MCKQRILPRFPPNPQFHLRRLELPSPYDSSSSDFSSLLPNSIPPLFALSLYFYTSQLYHTIDTAVQPGRKLTIWPACFCAIVLACFFPTPPSSAARLSEPATARGRTNVSTADFLRTFIRRPGFCWAVVPLFFILHAPILLPHLSSRPLPRTCSSVLTTSCSGLVEYAAEWGCATPGLLCSLNREPKSTCDIPVGPPPRYSAYQPTHSHPRAPRPVHVGLKHAKCLAAVSSRILAPGITARLRLGDNRLLPAIANPPTTALLHLRSHQSFPTLLPRLSRTPRIPPFHRASIPPCPSPRITLLRAVSL